MTTKKAAQIFVPKTHPDRRSAREALAANLKILMGDQWTTKTLATKGKTSKRAIDYMLDGKTYNPLKHVENVARKLNTDAWVLLCPTEIIEISDVFKVYLETTDAGKKAIKIGLKAARQLRDGEDI